MHFCSFRFNKIHIFFLSEMIVKICYTKLVTNKVSKFYTTNPFQNVTDNAQFMHILRQYFILLCLIIISKEKDNQLPIFEKANPTQAYNLRRVVMGSRHKGHDEMVTPHSLQVLERKTKIKKHKKKSEK